MPGPTDEAPRIVRIEFVGNALYATDSMKELMRLKEGGRLDRGALETDTAMLYRFFQEVKIDQMPAPGGVVLRITVTENPLVRELVFNGLEAMKEEEIKALPIRTRVGYPWFPRDQELDREDIKSAYRKKGYHFADVTTPTTPQSLPGGGRRIVFTIVEGPQVKVDKLILIGNEAIARKKIVEVMQTKEGWIFLDRKDYVEAELRADLVEVRKLYRSLGYLDAEVVAENPRFTDDRSKVLVTVVISEGEQYTVGNVSWKKVTGDVGASEEVRETTGPGAMPPEDAAWFNDTNLTEWLGLVPGEIYSGKTETKGRDRIREEYYKRSYLDARVEQSELHPRATGRVVDLRFRVIEGRKQRVAAVHIYGNEYTRDKIIRRDIHQEPGGYVDRNELDRGLTRLRALRYFERVSRRIEDVAGPDGKPVGDLKDVIYEVSEGKTGKLSLGVSLSTDGGVGASASFSKRNFDIARPPTSWDDLTSGRAFTGAGQSFSVFLSPGTVNSSFGFEFGEPRLFGSDFGFGVGFAKRLAYREDYTEDFLGYHLRLTHPLYQARDDSVVADASLLWRHEYIDLQDVSSGAVPGVFLFLDTNEVRSLTLVLSLRTVDDAARPGHKTSTTLATELAGGILGGDIDYLKVTLNHDNRWVVSEDDEARRRFVTASFIAGVSSALDDTPEVPPYARYYAGGRGTLRGFRYRGVGPHSNGSPMGGQFLLAGTLEYEHPVMTDMMSLVAFTDAGTLGTSIHDSDAFLLRLSIGLGIRLKIPQLGDAPLALDFAYPLVMHDEDVSTFVSFSLARDF